MKRKGLEKNRDQLMEELQQSKEKLTNFIEDIADMIMEIVELRDPYLKGHHLRVSKLATAIARQMSLPWDKVDGVRIASLVHDVGKVILPTDITSKPKQLVEVEFNLVKNYPKVGYEILKKVNFPWPIADIVYQHQERIDGSGYPRGVEGSEILIEAKILAVANVVEAMTSHKSYRPALTIKEALNEIEKHKNILFDPDVVDVCVNLFKVKDFSFNK